MEEKGLCSTCVNDKECSFSRKSPVLQCEEFSSYEPRPTRTEKTGQEKRKPDEEPASGEFIGE